MGTVYRASDTKLHREVAIKVLPEAFAQDADRMTRFTREAQVLASLNHPNIAAIYAIEQGAIVMELVEGEDLKGPLKVETAVNYARQIAEGLEAAHEKGVVHRDLKPANIKVTPSGQVKLLDFGLAAASSVGEASDETRTISLTKPGMILGTAGYMSPEQARGKPGDRRADIWAFGAVLYEMLTGRAAFGRGDTVSDSIAAVMRDEPDWTALPARTPVNVRRLLHLCLRKDPKMRLQAIGDARVSLEEPAETGTGGAPSTAWRWIPWVVASLALVVAATALWFRPVAAREAVAIRFTIPYPEGTTATALVAAPQAVPSPDGRQVAFIARRQSDGKTFVWIRRLESLTAQRLEKSEGANLPFWSPDGQSIGFFADGQLKRIAANGGYVQTICRLAREQSQGNGGTWNRDGVILFSSLGRQPLIMRVAAAGGEPAPATSLDAKTGETGHSWPQFLPDGRRFLYLARGKNEDDGAIYVQEIGSGQRTLILKNSTRGAFVAPGYILFAREGTLFAQALDTANWQARGQPFAIAEDLPTNISNGRANFGVSASGALAYRETGQGYATQFAWYDRRGKRLGTLGNPLEAHGFVLSPDERRIAVIIHSKAARDDTWFMDTTTGVLARPGFRSDTLRTRGQAWSVDSQRFAAGSDADIEELSLQTGKTFRIPIDRAVVQAGSPDGQSWIVSKQQKVFLLPASVSAKSNPEPLFEDAYLKSHLRPSPDGKAIAWISSESGDSELYVARYPGFTDKQRVSTSGASGVEWDRDGSGLVFVHAGTLRRVDVKTSPAISAGAPRDLFPVNLINSESGRQAFVTLKDGRLLLAETTKRLEGSHIAVVLNWMVEVK